MTNRNNFFAWFLLLLFSAPGFAQDSSTPAEDQAAALSGIVTNSISGEPLAHVQITVFNANSDVATARNMLTNADGRFAMANLTPGTYILFAQRRGFQPDGGWNRDEGNARIPLTIKAGEEIRDLALSLVPDSVIAGRVVDSDGLPLEGVTVQALSGAPVQTIQTDDRGEFRIGGLQAGRYLVKALVEEPPLPEIRTDGTPVINYGPTYYPGSRSAKSAATVLVHAGQETSGIEIKMLTSPILHVSGRVSNTPKLSRVSLQLDDGLTRRGFFPKADGKFTIQHLRPGQYQLYGEYVTDTGVILRSAPADIHLTTSNIEGINLSLLPPINLAGQMRLDGDTKIKGEEGEPLINLEPLGMISDAEESGPTDADGTFKLENLWPLRYHVLLHGAQKGFYVKSVRLNEREFQDGILDLRSGPGKGVLTVELGADGAEISGVVHDEKGAATHSRIALFFDDEYGCDQADDTNTHPDGTYEFHGVAPGKYKIVAYHFGGDVWTEDTLALYSSIIERIEVHAGDKVSQDLKVLSVP